MPANTTAFEEYKVFAKFVARPTTGGTNLNLGKIYLIIGMSDDDYRVVDEILSPCLHPRECFVPSDLEPPANWSTTHYTDGSYHSYDPASGGKKLIMDMFDGVPEAVREYHERIRKLLAESE